MNGFIPLVLISCLLWAIIPGSGLCADPAPRPPKGRDAAWKPSGPIMMEGPPVIHKLGRGVFQVGHVTVNKPEGFVSAQAQVNMDEGLVEYLACGPQGKLHESVLMLLAQPYELQIALLLFGLEPGLNATSAQGAPGVPDGDPVEIWVSWPSKNQERVRHRAEALVLNIKTQKAMHSTHWIYTGSQILDGRFMAQVEQSVAATYHDPFALFDHPLPTGEDDSLYHVNHQTVPPKGTIVSFVIKPVKKKSGESPP